MLEVFLPGSISRFYIDTTAEFASIENELYHTFFPYALPVEIPTFSHNELLIVASDYKIKIYRNNTLIREIKHRTSFSIYKKIFNIIRENILLSKGYCFLHGAAISFHQKTILFLAKSYSGKSTLSVYFDNIDGAMCLTDDLIIMNTHSMRIYPISKFAQLRKDSLLYLGDLSKNLRYCELIGRYQYCFSEKRFNNLFFADSIVFLKGDFEKHAPPILNAFNNPFNEILQNMYLPYQISNNLSSAGILCSQLKTYELSYSNLKDINDLLFNL